MEEKKNNKHAAANKKAEEKEETISIPKKEYECLIAKCGERDSFSDRFSRAQAEFENARKRLEKDKADFLKYAQEGFVIELLPILDSLEIAEHHIEEAKDFNAVREGVGMIQGQIQIFLKGLGVERIKTVGEKFDPHMHEAIETEESVDKDDGTIVGELKPGYRLNGRLLRPAMVKIAKKKSEEKKG
ncbi:MAG: nucleotide exchange factor GrpE [Candidatus Omnitrophota bacterium]